MTFLFGGTTIERMTEARPRADRTLIATVIGCTIALVTVAVTGFAVLRADLRELRADMREDRAEVLTEVRANRDRIDANRDRIDANRERIDANGDRIDAILNEIRALHGVAPLALAPPTAPSPGR